MNFLSQSVLFTWLDIILFKFYYLKKLCGNIDYSGFMNIELKSELTHMQERSKGFWLWGHLHCVWGKQLLSPKVVVLHGIETYHGFL